MQMTREQATALAEWMGRAPLWTAPPVGAPYYLVVPDWNDGGDMNKPDDLVEIYFSGQAERWNPFTTANDDVQVLERARGTWAAEWGMSEGEREEPWPWMVFRSRVGAAADYRTGDYTRAVLSIIQPEGER